MVCQFHNSELVFQDKEYHIDPKSIQAYQRLDAARRMAEVWFYLESSDNTIA